MKMSLILISLALLGSCQPDSSGANSHKKKNKQQNAVTVKDIDSKETYVAVLKSINETAGPITGAVTVNIDGDLMVANVRVSGSTPDTIQAQAIHVSHFCPTEVADENLDGYIDIIEAQPFTSSVIIPLDGDINSQLSQHGMFPTSDAWGSYIYSVTNSYKMLMDDLYTPDEDPEDNMVKLAKGMPLNLGEKVVVIYGVADSVVLPETVQTLPGLSSNQTLPIACGVFSKISVIPGTVEGDDRTIGTIGNPTGTNPTRPTIPGTTPGTTPGNGQPSTGNNNPRCPREKDC